MAINYEKVGWDTTKFVGPTNMNQMDDGIKAACDGVDALNTAMGSADISGVGDGTVKGAIKEVNNNLSYIGKVYKFTVGSEQQKLIEGSNRLTCPTELPAGLYLFTVNGIHETGTLQYKIKDIIFIAGDNIIRNYYGGDCPGMSISGALTVDNNPDVCVQLVSNVECVTYSLWFIQAIRLL